MGVVSSVKGHIEALMTGLKYLLLKPRLTILYPEQAERLPEGYRGMPRYDKNKCVSCSLCANICPADAMKMVKIGEKKYPSINYNRCIFCGFCVDICPTGALEYSPVHDYASYSLEELEFSPEKFAEGPPEAPFKPEILRIETDEKVGLKYVHSKS